MDDPSLLTFWKVSFCLCRIDVGVTQWLAKTRKINPNTKTVISLKTKNIPVNGQSDYNRETISIWTAHFETCRQTIRKPITIVAWTIRHTLVSMAILISLRVLTTHCGNNAVFHLRRFFTIYVFMRLQRSQKLPNLEDKVKELTLLKSPRRFCLPPETQQE